MNNTGIYHSATAILDLILPRICMVCGRRLRIKEKYLCIYCMSDLPLTYFWESSRNPMADRYNDMIQRTPAYEKYSYAAALFHYRAEAGYKKIPRGLKYHSEIGAGKFFSGILGEKLAGSGLFKDVDHIIPVPLHWTRRWKRGYNQAEIIAAGIAEKMDTKMDTDILFRTRLTKTQTRLKIEEKERNVSGAFGVNLRKASKLSSAKHILLVDDVFTTGATMNACHSALRTIIPKTVRISAVSLGVV
ncbi:MAG: hypothetical protein LKI42_02410 [Bacteroidales bacterium]|jgi:ComF family protein|nr:hypothetical protein [Bacteroidales bacterium]MCI1784934.1 hypothetical protein [Bacteroidales bacterium]